MCSLLIKSKKSICEIHLPIGNLFEGNYGQGNNLFPNIDKGLEVHVDDDLSGNWDKEDSENTNTTRSRHGFAISYKGCPIVWKLSLHTEVVLPSTESEYIGFYMP